MSKTNSKGCLYYDGFEERGRLGNQLFQIAGMALMAKRLDLNFQMLITQKAVAQWKYKDYFTAKIPTAMTIPKESKCYKIESSDPHDDNFVQGTYRDGDTFDGYFQVAAPFFDPSRQDLLRQVFQRRPSLVTLAGPETLQGFGDGKQQQQQQQQSHNLNELKSGSILCAIHFRFGDYRLLRDGQCMLPLAYYQRSMAFVQAELQSVPLSGKPVGLGQAELQSAPLSGKPVGLGQAELLRRVQGGESKGLGQTKLRLEQNKPLHWVVFSDEPVAANQAMLALGIGKATYSLVATKSQEEKNVDDTDDIKELFAMADCQHHICANSSFSWWGAKLSELWFPSTISDHIVCCPVPWFSHEPKSHELMIPPHWVGISAAPRIVTNRPKDEKTTFKHSIIPLPYAIPTSIIISPEAPVHKHHILADLLPNVSKTYRFGPRDEAKYHQMYRDSRFAITMKKGGWDCLRHYEILANGCIPMFEELVDCPSLTMTTYPKTLVRLAMKELLPYKEEEYAAKYEFFRRQLLQHLRDHCTTKALGESILTRLKLDRNPKAKLLMLTGNQEISYSRELAILGLREVMGNRFLEYPKQSILYTSVDSKTKARAYGHGFTYAGKLSDLDEHKHMSEASVKQQIENGEFDAVVFGKIGVWDDGVLNSPFWPSVKNHCKCIGFMFGGDKEQSMKKASEATILSEQEFRNLHRWADTASNEHLRFHLQFGTCFVRELIP